MKNRKYRRIKIHKEGYAILFSLLSVLLASNIIVYVESPTRAIFILNLLISVATFSFFVYFFRNPSRQADIDDPNLVIAPADGRIVVTEPTEVYEYFDGKRMIQVSIFMSVFSVHANWYPINGMVRYSRHHNGRHVAAYLPKSSHENEHSSVVIQSENKHLIMVRQIAGALARRIITYAAPNHACHLNEHLGFIKFGSRVDIFLPEDSEIFVQIGDQTRGNETIIARLPDCQNETDRL